MEQNITKEIIQELIAQKDEVGKHFELEVIDFNENYAICQMPLKAQHKNPLGIAHGAAIFSLADLTFVAASHAYGLVAVNTQSSLSFLNKGTGEKLTAKAILLKASKKILVYQVNVFDEKETIIAQGQITGYIVGTVQDLLNSLA